MATGIAWVLNLDADLELGAGVNYAPAPRVRRAMIAPADRLSLSLLGPDDVRVDEERSDPRARGLVGRAFCPTPRALEILTRAGAAPERHPPVGVLRRVNSRAFASALGATLPGASFVTDLETARAKLRLPPPIGEDWRVKHAFGVAGRNQRVVARHSIRDRDLAFVALGIARGGVQIEPNVAVEEEYAVHGFVPEGGQARVGAVMRQRCNERGAWRASDPLVAPPPIPDLPDRLASECRHVAGALRAAGYFGPFGVDAYSYKDASGALRLQPRSEINARYTMGFPRSLVPLVGPPGARLF